MIFPSKSSLSISIILMRPLQFDFQWDSLLRSASSFTKVLFICISSCTILSLASASGLIKDISSRSCLPICNTFMANLVHHKAFSFSPPCNYLGEQLLGRRHNFSMNTSFCLLFLPKPMFTVQVTNLGPIVGPI